MICFYHNDADGKCAGYLVRKLAINPDVFLEDQYVPMDYAKPFPIEMVQKEEQVYIVDFSISPDEMRELLKITLNVTWIDHHKTAIEKYKDFEFPIRGLRHDGIAGCMLTYCYLAYMTNGGLGEERGFIPEHGDNAPWYVKYIADWDVWKFDYGDQTRNFMVGFGAHDFSPLSKRWLGLDMDALACVNLMREGYFMTQFRDNWACEYMSLGFETTFEGKRCFAVNLGHCNSEYFKSLPKGKYDILMPFVFDGTQFTVSLYSEVVDVSEIAKKYGGGGHRGASGFQCKQLPFSKMGES